MTCCRKLNCLSSSLLSAGDILEELAVISYIVSDVALCLAGRSLSLNCLICVYLCRKNHSSYLLRERTVCECCCICSSTLCFICRLSYHLLRCIYSLCNNVCSIVSAGYCSCALRIICAEFVDRCAVVMTYSLENNICSLKLLSLSCVAVIDLAVVSLIVSYVTVFLTGSSLSLNSCECVLLNRDNFTGLNYLLTVIAVCIACVALFLVGSFLSVYDSCILMICSIDLALEGILAYLAAYGAAIVVNSLLNASACALEILLISILLCKVMSKLSDLYLISSCFLCACCILKDLVAAAALEVLDISFLCAGSFLRLNSCKLMCMVYSYLNSLCNSLCSSSNNCDSCVALSNSSYLTCFINCSDLFISALICYILVCSIIGLDCSSDLCSIADLLK